MKAVSSFCVHFWQIIVFVSVVLNGINGAQAKGWLNAHATFYGVNQAPATFGKLQNYAYN